LTVLINLNNGSIIRLKEFLKNLEKLLIGIDLIREKYTEFFIRTINALNGNK
jgi:hypothetical protein